MFCDDMVNCLQANIELVMAVIARITSLEVHTASKINFFQKLKLVLKDTYQNL